MDLLQDEISEDEFWAFVQQLDFSQAKSEVESELTLRLAPLQLKSLRNTARELEGQLKDAAYDAHNGPDWISEDGAAETAGKIIAMGRERYYETLDDPEIFWDEYESINGPIFSYYLPFKSDYEKITDGYYRRRGESLAEKYEDIAADEKYADEYREAADDLYYMLQEGIEALRGNSRRNTYYDDKTYDRQLMIKAAEKLSDDVPPQHVKRFVRDYENYYQGYYEN